MTRIYQNYKIVENHCHLIFKKVFFKWSTVDNAIVKLCKIMQLLYRMMEAFTSFPFVSPLSNHSTVTLFVSALIPDTTAE